MTTKKLKINISTRILLYFLFVSIIPLAILSISSTFLLNFTLNDKSDQELAAKMESVQTTFYNLFNQFKNVENINSFKNLSRLVSDDDWHKTKEIDQNLLNIRQELNLNFIIVYDSKFNKYQAVSYADKLLLTGVNTVNFDFMSLSNAFEKQNILVSYDIIPIKILNLLKLKEKIVINSSNVNNKSLGILSQLFVKPISTFDKDKNILITKGYVIGGIFVDNKSYIKNLLKENNNFPVNILIDNKIVSSNSPINFDLTNIEVEKQPFFMFFSKYRHEILVSNKWYIVTSENINDYKNNTIGKIVVGIEEEIFRSLKVKNSLLILQVSVLVACAGLILAFLFTKNLTDPINKMILAIREIEAGNSKLTLDTTREDELGELAKSIFHMESVIDTREKEILNYNKLLLDQKTKLESIFNSSADGIMTINKDNMITSVNKTIVKWANTNEESILNRFFYEIIKYKPDNIRANTSLPDIDKINNLPVINKYYPNAFINEISLEITYSPIILDDMNDINHVLILRDITKRKETEELRENFIATLTHDLRVPLLASVNTLEYMLKGSYGELEEKQKFITEQLISSNNDLLRMVNALLDTYSYEAGKYTLVKREINVNKLIKDCLHEIQTLALQKKQILQFIEVSENVSVIADRQELKRVIINLISNAIIHTPEKGCIDVSIEELPSECIVKIIDNGIGISEKDKEMIFQRYIRGGKTLRKVGTGLGLYLSKYIIEAHGGRIGVETELNVGSTFYFVIPTKSKRKDNNE